MLDFSKNDAMLLLNLFFRFYFNGIVFLNELLYTSLSGCCDIMREVERAEYLVRLNFDQNSSVVSIPVVIKYSLNE
jgi:hypothetical protein